MTTTPLLWKQVVTAKGCARAGPDCDGPVQGHHVISQQQLRKLGFELYTWDGRNGMALCYYHHRRHDNATERIPYRFLTSANINFANELGLSYLLDRYYPKEEQMGDQIWRDPPPVTVETVDSSSPDYLHPAESVSDAVAVAEPVMEGPAQVERCPTCERALPKPHTDEEARVRKGWTIAVPVDERENGAEVLDTLLDECRKLFGHDTNKKVRYYTVVQALAVVVQNGAFLAAESHPPALAVPPHERPGVDAA